MLEGAVAQVSADSTEGTFRALIDPAHQHLDSDGRRHALAAGMQVVAEIHLGSRTVLEYLLSPVRKAFHEAGRER
jgi:HlyD family secretion protein